MYKGKVTPDGVIKPKNSFENMATSGDSLCNMSEVTRGNFKKIKVNIEIVNKSESE